jgi:DNA-directed RNA polymerase subunit H (RpoH/RPB5)
MELEIGRIRGYNLSKNERGYYSDGKVAVVYEPGKMNKSSASDLSDRITEPNVVIIYDEGEVPSMHCIEALDRDDRYLELIDAALLKADIRNHVSQPDYRVSSASGKFPVIPTSSPVARIYGWRAGTVVEATVRSPVSGFIKKLYSVEGPPFRK